MNLMSEIQNPSSNPLLVLFNYPPLNLQPLDVVFGLLSNELDSLQDVSDVIDASLLHFQNFGSPVQVKNSIRGLGDQTHKFFGQQAQ